MATLYPKAGWMSMLLAVLLSGCAFNPAAEPPQPPLIDLAALLTRVAARAQADGLVGPEPAYRAALLADGMLSVALVVGTDDLGRVQVPATVDQRSCVVPAAVDGRQVRLAGRLVLSRAAFSRALAECELLFVTSHSRYGAGPVFLEDGKAQPYRMQRSPGYEIVMPTDQVSGYAGTVVRRFVDPATRRDYTVFAADSTDLDAQQPLPGCQVLVLSTCSSRRHFADEIAAFRRGLPTVAICTRRPCLMDPQMRVFMRCVYAVLTGEPPAGIAAGLDREYNAVAWQHVRRREPPWRVIDTLYTVCLDTAGDDRMP